MPDAVYGEFCQWYPSTFTVSKSQLSSLVGHSIEDADTDADAGSSITFNCAEQFMMYCKAGRFHDQETQRRVLATDSPKEQKRLGRWTAGFTDTTWDEVKSAVVVAGNIAKFAQNPKLKRKLLTTGDRLLVKAASRDRIPRGMGHWLHGKTCHVAPTARGENRLGKALMVAREHLRKEEAVQ
jgi:ribA/ribD-fused uncharacterized protein